MEQKEEKVLTSPPPPEKETVLLRIKSFLTRKKAFLIIFLIQVFILDIFLLLKIISQKPAFLSPLAENGEILAIATSSAQPKEVIGFLPSWMIAKGASVYPERLTQLIYFGLSVTENGELIKYNQDNSSVTEWSYFNSAYFSNLRKEAKENNTQVLVAIGCFDNEKIDKIISNSINRQRLINELIDLIEEYELDGINIDFEYIPATDFPTKKYFSQFLEELTSSLKEKDPALIVSVDIYANAALHDNPYDIEKVAQIADQVILMAYDFHRPDSIKAGPVAPIRAPENESSIVETFKAILNKSPLGKFVLGVPFYGYEWRTTSEDHRSLTYPDSGALATYKRARGILEDQEINVQWDSQAMSPWLVYSQGGIIKQIYYEDDRSFSLKLQLVKQLKLSGIAIWALGYEGEYQEPWKIISQSFTD